MRQWSLSIVENGNGTVEPEYSGACEWDSGGDWEQDRDSRQCSAVVLVSVQTKCKTRSHGREEYAC